MSTDTKDNCDNTFRNIGLTIQGEYESDYKNKDIFSISYKHAGCNKKNLIKINILNIN
jgi:hypothetical protein